SPSRRRRSSARRCRLRAFGAGAGARACRRPRPRARARWMSTARCRRAFRRRDRRGRPARRERSRGRSSRRPAAAGRRLVRPPRRRRRWGGACSSRRRRRGPSGRGPRRSRSSRSPARRGPAWPVRPGSGSARGSSRRVDACLARSPQAARRARAGGVRRPRAPWRLGRRWIPVLPVSLPRARLRGTRRSYGSCHCATLPLPPDQNVLRTYSEADMRPITLKGDSARQSLLRGIRTVVRASLYSRPVPELLDYRDRFPILAETTYLINHSLGAMPAEAEERLAAYAGAWKTRGVRAWEEGWWELPLTTGDQITRLIGAPPGTVSMHQNVTLAEAVVLSCFGFEGERRRIVYEEGNFPSVRYLYQAARGAEVVVAADDEGVVAAIDERTLLVPVTHVLFKTGEIQDVEAIVARAHEAGALVVLDAYQSVGTVPLVVTKLGVD